MAAREKVPIYLKSATIYCWRLYKRLGFVTLEDIVLGEGKSAADRKVCAGGPEVRT